MEKCATGVCLPVASWMENKPLVIGLAVVVFALIVGGYFWWRSRGSAAPSAEEPQVEEFVGRQGATRQEFEAAAAAAAEQEQRAPDGEAEHQHQE